MKKIIVTRELENMPSVYYSAKKNTFLGITNRIYMPFPIGAKGYYINEGKLVAFKVLHYGYNVDNKFTYMTFQLPNNEIHTMQISQDSLLFDSINDYYDYIGGDKDAKKVINSKIFRDFSDIVKYEYRVPQIGILSYKFGRTYKFDSRTQTIKEYSTDIGAIVIDADNVYVLVKPYNDYIYWDKTECLKENMIKDIVDFEEDSPNVVVDKIQVTTPINVTEKRIRIIVD